ncbi:hypothetical protein AMELA_G00084230 [Ameiurus melas]|uniref:Uncharacterized protein n=1 Tax=Ameiurus melas TaxID=219545 RepID=A0A7J6B0B3_AMEME|nr:hypothetical protein AMELA_G00084230 [Ameiurus melas]
MRCCLTASIACGGVSGPECYCHHTTASEPPLHARWMPRGAAFIEKYSAPSPTCPTTPFRLAPHLVMPG